MIPLLLISDDQKKIKNYLGQFKEKKYLVIDLKPEKEEFSIAEIKHFHKEIGIFHKNIRVYVLENFHLSSLEAQNSILKLLEEPPNNTLIVLSAPSDSKLLPTITSRTKIIFLGKKYEYKSDPEIEKLLNSFINKKGFNLFADRQFTVSNKEEAGTFIDQVIFLFRNRLINDKKASRIIKEAIRLKNLLQNNNLNHQLTIDHILIFIKKQYTMDLGHEK